MEEVRERKCNLCGGSIELFLDGIFDCDETQVYECKDCELQFLHPIMTLQEEKEYYHNYYKTQKNRYISSNSLDKIAINSYEYHKEYLENYKEYFLNKDISVLEIGSGTGGFINLLRNDFGVSNIKIVEKSHSNMSYLENKYSEIDVYSELNEVKDKFDIIVGIALFEHLRKPLDFLKQLYDMINPNGVVILEMPSKRDPLVELYKINEFKKFNYQKQHYYTYSEKNLHIVAQKTNFKIDKFYYTQVYSLDNHISWLNHRKVQDYSFYTNLFSTSTLLKYKEDLIKKKITDVIGVVFKK